MTVLRIIVFDAVWLLIMVYLFVAMFGALCSVLLGRNLLPPQQWRREP